jgi:hypothetical protein
MLGSASPGDLGGVRLLSQPTQWVCATYDAATYCVIPHRGHVSIGTRQSLDRGIAIVVGSLVALLCTAA